MPGWGRLVEGHPAIHSASLEGMQEVLRDLGSSATVTKVTVADDLSNLDEAKNAAGQADVGADGRLGGDRGVDQPTPTCSMIKTGCCTNCWASTQQRS